MKGMSLLPGSPSEGNGRGARRKRERSDLHPQDKQGDKVV
jgi:hypothetical protein